MTGRGRESVNPHDGTEIRAIHLRVAASRNIAQWDESPDAATPCEGRRLSGCKLTLKRSGKLRASSSGNTGAPSIIRFYWA